MISFPKWKTALVLLVSILGVAYTIPNFIPAEKLVDMPEWAPRQHINLGLDLQGGSHLLMQVDTADVKEKMMEGLADSVRANLRGTEPKLGFRNLTVNKNSVTFSLRNPEDRDLVRERLASISNLMPNGQRSHLITIGDDDVVTLEPSEQAIADRVSAVVTQSIEIVGRRVNETGINEPTIQRQGKDRILVQLPGLGDPQRIIDLLGQTAQMTFHLVDVSASAAVGRPPAGSKRLPAMEAGEPDYVIKNRVMVSGENLEDAQATFQQGQPVVSIRFNGLGGKQFGKVTS
jgi:protein-export membrane protein SecD